MRTSLIVLIAALALVQGYAASAAADVPNGQPPTLHDWLMSIITKPAAGGSAAISTPRVASMYPEPEKDDVCLKVVESCKDNCPDCGFHIRYTQREE